jgi:hypothetical protein
LWLARELPYNPGPGANTYGACKEIGMKAGYFVIVAGILLGSQAAFAADDPTPEAVVEKMLESAGGSDAFERLGVVEFAIDQEETLSDGERITSSFVAYTIGSNLDTTRIDLSETVVVASHNGTGWATKDGEPDTRPQTPRMVVGTIHQKLFPLLLPFSLTAAGVHASDVVAATFEDQPVWHLTIIFDRQFFVSPSMNTEWLLTVRRSDHALLAAEFLPPTEFRKVTTEGVRYRYLQHGTIEEVRLPTQVVLDGIDFERVENGHVRVTKIKPSIRGPFDPELFVDPRRLELLEGGVPGIK